MNKDDIELAHFVLYHAKILLDHGAANTIAKELQDGELPYSKALSTAVTLLEQNGATPPPKSARDDLEKPCEPEFRSREGGRQMDDKKFIRWLIAICAISVVTTAINVWLHFAG